MNGYLFTASVSRSLLREAAASRRPAAHRPQTWNACLSSIVCSDNADEAKKLFEASLHASPEGEDPFETQINKLVAAQFVEQLLMEKDSAPIDWPQIAKQAQLDLESTPADDFEQGYWVDVNAFRRPCANLEALRQALPEDIRSGLNWAEEKQFFFLLSVLSPADEPGAGAPDAAPEPDEAASGAAGGIFDTQADFPEVADKESAVLIRARNSAVAAWLWRKYAANAKFARNQIRIDPWCGVMGVEPTK